MEKGPNVGKVEIDELLQTYKRYIMESGIEGCKEITQQIEELEVEEKGKKDYSR